MAGHFNTQNTSTDDKWLSGEREKNLKDRVSDATAREGETFPSFTSDSGVRLSKWLSATRSPDRQNRRMTATFFFFFLLIKSYVIWQHGAHELTEFCRIGIMCMECLHGNIKSIGAATDKQKQTYISKWLQFSCIFFSFNLVSLMELIKLEQA